jgi:hypothetical protein
MALSGTITKAVGSWWRLRLVWSGSQSTSGNYTDITMRVYWEATASYPVNASSTKTGYSYIDGTSKSHSYTAGLSGYQSKEIMYQTKRVYHGSDGSKSLEIKATVPLEVTLSGSYRGTIYLSTGTVTLDKIARASTLSSSAYWTAGDALVVSASRADSSFSHIANIEVDGVEVASVSFNASTTIYWDTAQLTQTFELMATEAKSTRIVLHTYNGGTWIGSRTYTGTIYVPEPSKVTGLPTSFNLGDDLSFTVDRKHGGFRHNIGVYYNNDIYLTSVTDVGNAGTWVPTQSQLDTIYEANTSTDRTTIRLRCRMYYNGVMVRSDYYDSTTTGVITDAVPEFTNTQIAYRDISSTTTALTGNDQYIVAGKSFFQAQILTPAQAQKGATIVKYVITIDGQTEEVTSTGNYGIGTLSNRYYQQLSITAYDSRGLSQRASLDVTMLTYYNPTVYLSVARQNKFGETTNGTVNGSFSQLVVDGTPKNSITAVRYRFREQGTGEAGWSGWSTVSHTTSSGSFLSNDFQMTLNITKKYDVQAQVTDTVGTTIYDLEVVGAGQPIFFIDTGKNSVGVNKLPTQTNALEVEGDLHVSGQIIGGIDTTDLEVNTLTVGKDTYSPATISQSGTNTRIQNGTVYMDFDVASSSYVEIDTNASLIDFMAPVRMYNDDLDMNSNDILSVNDLQVNGHLTSTRHKFDNGFNWLSLRDGTLSDPTDMYLIQNISTYVSFSSSNLAYVDVTFPETFDSSPLWILAVAVNGNSYPYNASVYSPSASGCRVYLVHSQYTNDTRTIGVQVVACGRKS